MRGCPPRPPTLDAVDSSICMQYSRGPSCKAAFSARRCTLLCVTASKRQRERGWLSARNAEWRGGKAQPLSNTEKATQRSVASARLLRLCVLQLIILAVNCTSVFSTFVCATAHFLHREKSHGTPPTKNIIKLDFFFCLIMTIQSLCSFILSQCEPWACSDTQS